MDDLTTAFRWAIDSRSDGRLLLKIPVKLDRFGRRVGDRISIGLSSGMGINMIGTMRLEQRRHRRLYVLVWMDVAVTPDRG